MDAPVTRRQLLVGALATPALALLPGVSQAANPIQIENGKPGTTAWQLVNPAIDHEIEGYASLTSVNRGGQIQLFVHTTDPSYTMDVYRLGWYGGAGGRQVAGPITRPGIRQVMPTATSTGLIECNWTNPYVLTIPGSSDSTDWASGIYLVKLTGATSGKQSYIVFVVREDARASDFLFQSSVTTFQAYNAWGGKSLYFANSQNGAARVVSFNRPYDASRGGGGAGELFVANFNGPGWEYNMLRWLEREGYDVAYATDIDTHERSTLLFSHRAFLSVGHDEYWTWQMRDHVEAARDRGVHLAFLSSNVSYWQVRLDPSAITGAPSRTMIGYKNAAMSSDPYARDVDASNDRYVTTLFRNAPVNRPESQTVGVGWVYNTINTDMVISDAAHWAFAGTGLSNGDRLRGLLGYEVDAVMTGSPANIVRLATTTFSTPNAGTITSHMTIYTAPSGALVWATGSNQWAWGLDDFNVPQRRTSRLNPAAQQVTRNVLARFLGGSTPEPTPLTLGFVNPAWGATVSGSVTVTVSSSGGSGSGYSYRISVDGTQVYAGTNPSFSWNTTAVPNGSRTLRAEVTDSAGAATAATRTVTVSNGSSPGFTASFSNPSADGATVRSNLAVGMSTTAPWGQSKTWALTVDGTALTTQTTTSTVLWYTLNTTTLSNGQHTLTVRVTYNGATATGTRLINVAN